jgi:diguanylate cyclase (GGDEF)-like protein
MKILIAADNPLAQVILRQSLEALGHEATVVTEGGAAWERLQSDDFPLVISDWVLPDVNGLELCRRIRARDDGPAYTYVILLTDKSERDDRVEGYEAGADDFLSQPLDRGELLARVGVARRILTMQEELRRRSRQLELMHAELQRQYARLAEVAVSDGLTGLKNRRHFRECLETSFSFSCRKKLVLSVVMLDVDHFKHYNDTFGHPAGDAALAELGRLLRDNAREHDLVARYGGEEFVILLSATDAASATLCCERFRAIIANHRWPLRPITASFGVATSSSRIVNGLQLVDEADRALYISKNRGRNCVTHFEQSLLAVG